MRCRQWPKSDVQELPFNVCFRGRSGHNKLVLPCPLMADTNCKRRRCPARRAKTGNNRIQTTAFVNQYFLFPRNAGKVFFAPASKIFLQQYRPGADIEELRSPSGRTRLWCQAAFKAFSIHPIKWSSRSGLFRKQTAPAFMARARTLSSG